MLSLLKPPIGSGHFKFVHVLDTSLKPAGWEFGASAGMFLVAIQIRDRRRLNNVVGSVCRWRSSKGVFVCFPSSTFEEMMSPLAAGAVSGELEMTVGRKGGLLLDHLGGIMTAIVFFFLRCKELKTCHSRYKQMSDAFGHQPSSNFL